MIGLDSIAGVASQILALAAAVGLVTRPAIKTLKKYKDTIEGMQEGERANCEAIKASVADRQAIHADLANLKAGMVGVLGARLEDEAKAIIRRGGITPEEMKSLCALHEPYRACGGNGARTKLYKEAMSLPTKGE